ncbi:hypothetical protein [Polyangium sp. 6x1]|uniref:hypothetical protein n=1 Tax=Polyangium sp. 6x1 TaxID=3042689 RepID=UPI0024826FA0|nr:hypothetical protein [Polyangium sp. 6x1]MDI1450119.1 hypothetical protein [Polyangium sp. 6x1]
MIRPSLRPRSAFAVAALLAASLAACSNTQVPSTLTGEPVCADFTLGGATNKMRGGLRQPVRVTVLDDDEKVAHALILGKRAEGDPGVRLVLPDKDAEYKVEWSQCSNERASVPLRAGKTPERELTTYECGEAKAYKTETLITKKGDRASHTLTFQPPPNPSCWTDERPAEEPPKPAPEAAPPPEPADAGAEDAATDAAPADAGDAGTDAGAAKPPEKPADGTKDKPTEAPKTEAPKPAPLGPKPPEGPKPAATQ